MPSQPLHDSVADASEQGITTEVLDLTNSHLQTLAEVQISPRLKYLDLTANRLESLDPRILALTGASSSTRHCPLHDSVIA